MPIARPEPQDTRVIAHVDMDCFYVQGIFSPELLYVDLQTFITLPVSIFLEFFFCTGLLFLYFHFTFCSLKT